MSNYHSAEDFVDRRPRRQQSELYQAGLEPSAAELMSEAESIMRENQRRIKRMLRDTQSTNDNLGAVAEELHIQGGQIANMNRNLEAVHANAKVANRKMDSIDSVWGTIANKFKPKRRSQAKIAQRSKDGKVMKIEKKSQIAKGDPTPRRFFKVTQQGDDDDYNTLSKKNDDLLNLLSLELDTAKDRALDIGTEIQQQNEQLDATNLLADRTNGDMGRLNTRVRRML